MVFHVRGQIVVSLGEERFVTGPDGKIATANFEGGRFELGPIAALWLGHNLLKALQNYQATFGPLPKNALPAELQVNDAISALEEMLKNHRQQPPEPPGSPGMPPEPTT
jgi:hypothetical protein